MANSSSQPFNQPTDSGAFCTFLYKDTIPPCVIGIYAFIGRPMAQTLASIALSPGHSPPTHDLGMRLEVAWKKKHIQHVIVALQVTKLHWIRRQLYAMLSLTFFHIWLLCGRYQACTEIAM